MTRQWKGIQKKKKEEEKEMPKKDIELRPRAQAIIRAGCAYTRAGRPGMAYRC